MRGRVVSGGRPNNTWVWLVAALATAGCSSLPFAAAPVAPAAAAEPAAGLRASTLTYCTPARRPLRLDLSYPRSRRQQPVPVAVFIHGGAWEYGNRFHGDLVEVLRPALLRRGFAFAALEYRLAPSAPWPAQLQDVACAVRFLRHDSGRLGIDAHHVSVIGGSSGGHLAALLATVDRSQPVDVGQYLAESSRPDAVVDLYGPTDLVALRQWSAVRRVFGSDRRDLRLASPVTWAAPGDPPFLIVHGDADQLVPISQSRELQRRLESVHDDVSLVLVRGGPHGLGNSDEQPDPAGVADLVSRFLAGLLG